LYGLSYPRYAYELHRLYGSVHRATAPSFRVLGDRVVSWSRSPWPS